MEKIKENEDEIVMLRRELEKVYTPLEEARIEIWKRWNDPELRMKAENFFEGNLPKFYKESPKAVLARQIASPNHELIQFFSLAKDLSLEPACLEYLKDKFRAENGDKYFLGKLFFHKGFGKKGGIKNNATKVIDFDESEGKSFIEMKTLWGKDFIEFHHSLLNEVVNVPEKFVVDESEWIKSISSDPNVYYEKYLSIFICFGVLCENYLLNDCMIEFTKNIFLPNFKKVEKIFGVKPLIVNLCSIQEENDTYWRYYPEHVESLCAKIKENNINTKNNEFNK